MIEALLAKKHAGAPAWGNPLWLVLALEELDLLDTDDFADMQREYSGPPEERLANLMLDTVGHMPTDIVLLYHATFDSAPELLGTAVASAFIGLISASRTGWRESDFRQLLPQVSGEPWDESRFARCVACSAARFTSMAILRNGISTTPRRRLPPAHASQGCASRISQLHLLIADHLLSLAPDDRLRATETMVHLLASKDDTRAAQYYGDTSLSEAELQGATRALADAHDFAGDRHAGERSARDLSFA